MRFWTLFFSAVLCLALAASACERKATLVSGHASPGSAVPSAPASIPTSALGTATSATPGDDPDVRGIAPGKYAVSRKLFDHWTLGSGPETLERSSSVTPVEENGRTIGLRLAQLKPSGWLRQLGFREGDVVVDVNGQALSSPGRTMEIYARARHESSFKVGILRSAQRVEQVYEVSAR